MSVDIYDLCIIGAGMYGAAAARHASSNPALKICLIGPIEPSTTEKKTREIHSSHYDEGRIFHEAYSSHATHMLAKHTISRFRELEKLSGMEFYYPVGCIVASKRNSNYFYDYMQGIQASKIPFIDLSSGDMLKTRFPFLDLDKFEYPIFEDYGAGHLSPRKMIIAQKKVASLQGCDIIEDVVSGVKDFADGVHVIATESGRHVTTKRVLFCTGAFTQFKKFDLLKNLNISVHKETAVMMRVSERESERLSSMPTMIMYRDGLGDKPTPTAGAYILPPIRYPDGHNYLKIGHMGNQKNSAVSSIEEVRKWYNDEHGEPEIMKTYSKFLLKILPNLKVDKIMSKTCITCFSPTDLPYIDRITPTVTVAVVGNARGATICDEVGRLASKLSVSGEWDSDLSQSLFEVILEDK